MSTESHRFDWIQGGKAVCTKCGLIRLNNRLTGEAVKLGCDYKSHPSWPHKVKKHTRLFHEPT